MTDTTEQPSLLQHQLSAHPFTRGMAADDVETLLRYASLGEFKSRDVIFEAGDPADTFYLIRTGVVSLQLGESGAVPRKIQSIREGAVLGWSWLYPPYEWQFDAVAETITRVIAMDAVGLREHFETDPALGYRMVTRIATVMADRLHATRRELMEL